MKSPTFATPNVSVERRRDGAIIFCSNDRLDETSETLITVLAAQAARTPDLPLLRERAPSGEWRELTYAEAFESAITIAGELADRGIGRHQSVVALSGNSIDHALVMFGALAAGLLFAPVSVAYSLQSEDLGKLRAAVAQLDVGAVFADDLNLFGRAIAVIEGTGAHVLSSETVASLRVRPERTSRTTGFPVDVVQEDVAKILFTSGSTGRPKGVVNTHRMLASNQQQMRHIWPFLVREPAELVDWLPWSHTFGGNHNLNLVLWSGGTLHIDGGRPTPEGIRTSVENLRELAPTIYFNVPSGFAALLPHLESDSALAERFFSRLRLVMYAAAALPPDTWDRFQAVALKAGRSDLPLTASWGSTETAPLATSAHFPLDGPGCIGVPVPGVRLKLVPNGQKLEVRVQGPNVTPGYVGGPASSADAFDEEGYLITGDTVRFVDEQRPALGLLFDGRVAEDFKLATGTWVSVGAVRTSIVSCGRGKVTDAVITGHDGPELGAMLWVNADDPAAALQIARAAIEEHNAAHPQSSARIARACVLAEPPSIDGEVTDKGYINQRAVLEARGDVVRRLHGDSSDASILIFSA